MKELMTDQQSSFLSVMEVENDKLTIGATYCNSETGKGNKLIQIVNNESWISERLVGDLRFCLSLGRVVSELNTSFGL